MPTHVGTYDLITLQPRERWTPRGGRVTEPRTKMLNTSVATFTATLRSNGYAYEVEPLGESPFSIVTTLAVQEDATDTTVLADLWELDGNDLEKSIWELPKVKQQMEAITDLTDRATVRNDIEGIVRGEVEYSWSDASSFSRDVYDGLIKSLIAGVEAFPVSTYVLRRTITLPSNTALAPAFQYSNQIFTTASLVGYETTIPSNLRSALPVGYWQKKTPTAAQQSDGRWVYRVEYWWAAEFDEFLYETAI